MRLPTCSSRSNHYKTTTAFLGLPCIKGLAANRGSGVRCALDATNRQTNGE